MRKFICDKCGKEMPQDRRIILACHFNYIGNIETCTSEDMFLDICYDCLKAFKSLGSDEEKQDDTNS